MKLQDIFEVLSFRSATSVLASHMMSYIQALDNLRHYAENALADGMDPRRVRFTMGGPKSRWVAENYMGSRTSAGLQSVAFTLKREYPKAEKIFEKLKDIPMYAGAGTGKGKAFNRIGELLIELGDKMESVKSMSKKIKELQDKIDKAFDGAADDRKEEKKKDKKKEKGVMGVQAVAAEDVVNQVLADLPKEVRGEIRNAIAKSSNKIVALQMELAKRGIKI